MKKEWVKPELVVLMKVQSNEMVLENDCKIQGNVGPVGYKKPEEPYTGLCMNTEGDAACRGCGRGDS